MKKHSNCIYFPCEVAECPEDFEACNNTMLATYNLTLGKNEKHLEHDLQHSLEEMTFCPQLFWEAGMETTTAGEVCLMILNESFFYLSTPGPARKIPVTAVMMTRPASTNANASAPNPLSVCRKKMLTAKLRPYKVSTSHITFV